VKRTLIISAIISVAATWGSTARAYDRVAAVGHAHSYCQTRLPPGSPYSTWRGGDCANFVSQCLRAGGFTFDDWRKAKRGRGGTFLTPEELENWIKEHGMLVTDPSTCLREGDVVIYYHVNYPANPRLHHSAIVTQGYPNPVKISYHTNNQCDANLFGGGWVPYYYHILDPTYYFWESPSEYLGGYYYYLAGYWYGPVTGEERFKVGYDQGITTYRGYDEFYVQGLPSNATIVRASLELTCNGGTGGGNFSFDIKHVAGDPHPPTANQLTGSPYYLTNANFVGSAGNWAIYALPAAAYPDIMNSNNNGIYRYVIGYSKDSSTKTRAFDTWLPPPLIGSATLRVLVSDLPPECNPPSGGEGGGGPQGSDGQTNLKLPQEMQLTAVTPFTKSTSIVYALPRSSFVTLKVYDVKGSVVKILVTQREFGGSHRMVWDGKNDRGNLAPAGVYFLRLEALGTQKIVRTVLVR